MRTEVFLFIKIFLSATTNCELEKSFYRLNKLLRKMRRPFGLIVEFKEKRLF